MTKDKGICSVCGRETALLKDGRIGRHADQNRKRNQWPPQNCTGWGHMPEGWTADE